MFLPLLLLHLGGTDPGLVYNGRSGNLDVHPPRLDARATIDGTLDEPEWAQAAMLAGFSQYSPMDGVPAADSTEVYVWYSADAIYFGVRAYEAHGQVHATLADRDKIFADDFVQILLDTFDDGRQATVLSVNPFGVQSDGALVETGSTTGNGFNTAIIRREVADLSPDYVFESKGRLTDFGYEVEMRVPFKSLRFQPAKDQRWGINVTRTVQHSGQEDSWAPARRASASFLAQSGHLVGLTDLQRGLVLDINPSLTSKTSGAPAANGWEYSGGAPEVGGSLRWGITNNLNLNATANPDFSQVESDAGQFQFDPRDELFFSEKRPFFLDGSEQFTTPNQLIYTRRIVQPVAAVKLAGKALGTDIGFLSALDDRLASATGTDHPFYNLLRLQRDVGANSRLGLVYTDRVDGKNSNRVGGLDGRFVKGVYTAQFQVAGSRTTTADVTTTAPLFYGRIIAGGRTFGFRTTVNGSDADFRARSGFFSRPGFSHANFQPRVSFYGKSGSLMENLTVDLNLDGLYRYDQFATSAGMQEEKAHLNANLIMYGGWHLGVSVLNEHFGYPSEVYTDYRLELPHAGGGLDTAAFIGRPTIPNRDYVLSLDTPDFSQFSGSFFLRGGTTKISTSGPRGRFSGSPSVSTGGPPTSCGSAATISSTRSIGAPMAAWSTSRISPGSVEYQASRPIFIRLVGELTSERQSALRDDTRTDAPILIFDSQAGDFVRATAFRRRSFRATSSFSYQPTPGTVLFAGYGSTLRDPVDADDPPADRASAVRGRVLLQDELPLSHVACCASDAPLDVVGSPQPTVVSPACRVVQSSSGPLSSGPRCAPCTPRLTLPAPAVRRPGMAYLLPFLRLQLRHSVELAHSWKWGTLGCHDFRGPDLLGITRALQRHPRADREQLQAFQDAKLRHLAGARLRERPILP